MAARPTRRFAWVLLLFAVLAAIWFFHATRDPWPAQQGVAVAPGEAALTARVIASAVAAIDAAHVEGRPFARQSFAKPHGCVRATLRVPELEPRLRHGLFAQPAEHKAWIRFSNGDTRAGSDQLRDAHGLALKVTGVPGPKLLAAERDADTQDFVLADSPRFFLPDVAAYARFSDELARGDARAFFLEGGWWTPWRWRVRELYLATRSRHAPPASVLQTEYFSQTAYRLGPEQLVKYAARPCVSQRPPRQDRTEGMLRKGLREELAIGDACFELLVQLQVPGRNMPVEDPTVLWSESDSPFVPVATVTIPKQAIDAPGQDELCEALSFTPWHALPEHEPVGGLNRLRRAVYQEISRYRHARSGTTRSEPRGWCLDMTGSSCRDEAPAGAPATPAAVPVPAAAPTSTALPPSASPVETPAKPRPRPTATPTPSPDEPALEPPPSEPPPAVEPPPSEPPPL